MIPLTLASAVLILEKYSRKNLILTGIVVVLLFLTKLSALPVIACLALGMFLKVNKNLKLLVAGVLSVLGIIGVIVLWSSFILYFKGIGDFNLTNIFKTLPLYLSEFVGKNGKYLWYYNQQIEPLVGWLALLGCGLGLVWKKYRKITLILGMIILTVVIFHSQMSYPEGRYLSTVIPLYILFVGIFVDLFQKYWIKLAVVSIFLAGYLGVKTTVNGFYERKVTTLKRQILNNQLENNEVPWNYLAMENFNKFFKNKDDNQFLGTLLPPFYVAYFGNVNFKFLPISPLQEFAGGNKGYIEKTYENDGTLVNLYNRLIREGKSVYVSNYYLNNFQGKLSPDYKILENTFSFNQVSDGCMDLCKIYKLELKKK